MNPLQGEFSIPLTQKTRSTFSMSKIPTITYYPLLYGYICQSDCFSGIGLTRNESIDDWVKDVRDRGSIGAFNERSAKIIARRLRRTAR